MGNHTEGPFVVVLNPRYMNASIYGKRRNHVAEVWGGSHPTIETVEANARLLGNSLRMLDVIKAVIAADKIGPESMRAALVTAQEIVDEVEPCPTSNNGQ